LQHGAILFFPTYRGRDPVTERHLRPIAAEADWGEAEGDVEKNEFVVVRK
jgi:hypothetical protein